MEQLAERLKILTSDFEDLRDKVKRKEDVAERHILLRQLSEIIAEIDSVIHEAQRRLAAVVERLRLGLP